MSADADPNNRAGAFRFVVDAPMTDHAEKARLDAEQAYRQANKDANLNGVFFPVRKVYRDS